MKQKAITVICATLCLALFASSIYVFDGHSADTSAVGVYQTVTPTFSQWAEPAATPTPTMTPTEPETQGHDFTQGDVTMLAQIIYEESVVLDWRGDQYGVSSTARQAAVAWCALNRLDEGTFGDSLKEVLTTPYQFAYKEDTPVTESMLRLAEDVLTRWTTEHMTSKDVGRTLPADYLYFDGDGRENHFRKEYQDTGDYWDWSLQDPYKEG